MKKLDFFVYEGVSEKKYQESIKNSLSSVEEGVRAKLT